MCMDTPPCFSAIFTKNNYCDFLFASRRETAIPKGGMLLKKRIFSNKSKFFSELTWEGKGSKNDNGRVSGPEHINLLKPPQKNMAALMSDYNICLYGEKRKQISGNYHMLWPIDNMVQKVESTFN